MLVIQVFMHYTLASSLVCCTTMLSRETVRLVAKVLGDRLCGQKVLELPRFPGGIKSSYVILDK